MDQYDSIVEEWKSKDMVAKFLGIYSSRRLYSDWVAEAPVEATRKVATWMIFKAKMLEYYKPTENLTLKNFQFRTLSQEKDETFIAYCNRVEKEARHCQFKCVSAICSAEVTAIHDQVVIGITSDGIREEALKNSWDLTVLRKEGMRLESAAKGASEIAGKHKVNRMGKYSYKNSKNKEASKGDKKEKPLNCYFCGMASLRHDIVTHARQCPARSSVCTKCNITGHYAKVCRSERSVSEIRPVDQEEAVGETVHDVNIFHVSAANNEVDDFKIQLLINNNLDMVLADTGAGISVCGMATARQWNLVDRMTKTNVRIKPYNSKAIPAVGVSTCSDRTVPAQWYIIDGPCEPFLAGSKASHLGITQFKHSPEVFMPIQMIKSMIKLSEKKQMQDVIAAFPENFNDVGQLKNHVVKLRVDQGIKPVAGLPRCIPYHLKSRVDEVIDEMVSYGVIEEHPKGEHAPWVSNIVMAPKDDGDIRITLDAKMAIKP